MAHFFYFFSYRDTDKYAYLLRECISHEALLEGMHIHECILKDDTADSHYLQNILIEMYDKCGALEEARWTFDSLDIRNVYSWNNIIAAYARRRYDVEALHLFHEMLKTSDPNHFTINIILGACANLESLVEGKFVHNQIVYYGFDGDIDVLTGLLNTFEKSGSLTDALRIFRKLHAYNIVVFTIMISAYVQKQRFEEGMELFRYIHKTGVEIDDFLICTILGACSGKENLEEGRWIHSLAIQNGFSSERFIETALINMYGNCGSSDGADTVFQKSFSRDVALYTALITAYVKLGNCYEALKVFEQMQYEDIEANEVTFTSILGACEDSAYLPYGKMLYHTIINDGYESDLVVGGALVNMFGKCGSPEDAYIVFNKLQKRTIITWNALMTAHLQQGDGKSALELFWRLVSENQSPSEITFVYALTACGDLSSLDDGKMIHIDITKYGLDSHDKISNALVSMYGKCGGLREAFGIFNILPQRDIIAWNSLISAYTQCSLHRDALDLFEQMQMQGVKPDGVTFISVLSACTHAGLVVEGLQYFFSMIEVYYIEPVIEHYGCVIDLLSRAGQLEEADIFIEKLPLLSDSAMWRSFLAACKLHGDSELVRVNAEKVVDIDVEESPLYVLLGSVHVAEE
ncbi:hypothetical protein KP509_34G000500 [Ceratopteris richardii]|uniref:Pentatricopeptide repeat-containing protein n=1 Tax=Ceratopteris richardii TaxID=49495 RepID=A0A8T2QIU2_CERRI|nr:hypothetical protein KP509_34G000500 [Ceratopteris richardii]